MRKDLNIRLRRMSALVFAQSLGFTLLLCALGYYIAAAWSAIIMLTAFMRYEEEWKIMEELGEAE